MNTPEIPSSIPSNKNFESDKEKIRALFKTWSEKINNKITEGHIEHVGASNIPGALTKGDLDISVQVDQADFKTVCENIKHISNTHHPELWTKEFAIFTSNDEGIKVDIMVVVRDSTYDTFVKMRDSIASDELLLTEYNSIKENFTPQSAEYCAAKKSFFDEVLTEKLNIVS